MLAFEKDTFISDLERSKVCLKDSQQQSNMSGLPPLPRRMLPQPQQKVTPHPSQIAAVHCAWNQMQGASGPCQLWATCDKDCRFSIAFLSTSVHAWINYAMRSEDKILFGVLACVADGQTKFFKVMRIGCRVPDDIRQKAEALKSIPFNNIFTSSVGEILLHPDDDHHCISDKVCSILKCDPARVRL